MLIFLYVSVSSPDSCDPSLHRCGPNSTCVHRSDGYIECPCDPGFIGNGGDGCIGKFPELSHFLCGKYVLFYFVVALSHELDSHKQRRKGVVNCVYKLCPTTSYSVVQSCCSIFHKTDYIAD